MKLAFIFGTILALMIAFQNCGSNRRELFTSRSSDSREEAGCESLECFRSSDFLWLLIREYEPYKIKISNINSHITVGGDCGVGTFSDHRFHWELRENFGTEAVVGRGSFDNQCQVGKFQIPVYANQRHLKVNHSYQLVLELVAIDRELGQVGSPTSFSRGTLDILIVPDDD